MPRTLSAIAFTRWEGVMLAALLTLPGGLPSATAHGVLAGYIQHGIHLRVDAEHIDLTVDLTFFEEPSARERARMDANADGRVTRLEVDGYLKKLASELAKQVKLLIAGREVSMVPLYEPELELANDQTAALAHHRMRLAFFAATPPELKTNDLIVIKDQLWPEAKSLGTQQVTVGDGCQLLPETSVRPETSGELTRESWRFTFRCVKSPKPRPAPAKLPGALPSQSKPSVP